VATNAERQRRYRAHKAGDHSLCDPARRCDETATVTGVTLRPDATGRLDTTGRQLWAELAGEEAEGARRVLILEACRIADRLNRLDDLLAGDASAWMAFVAQRDNDEVVEIVIDKPLAEARQQAIALKQLVAELRQGAAGASQQPGQEVSVFDQLAARRAARLANAAGS